MQVVVPFTTANAEDNLDLVVGDSGVIKQFDSEGFWLVRFDCRVAEGDECLDPRDWVDPADTRNLRVEAEGEDRTDDGDAVYGHVILVLGLKTGNRSCVRL